MLHSCITPASCHLQVPLSRSAWLRSVKLSWTGLCSSRYKCCVSFGQGHKVLHMADMVVTVCMTVSCLVGCGCKIMVTCHLRYKYYTILQSKLMCSSAVVVEACQGRHVIHHNMSTCIVGHEQLNHYVHSHRVQMSILGESCTGTDKMGACSSEYV